MSETVNSIENMPDSVQHPTTVTETRAELGFTENDPVGPQGDADKAGLLAGKFKSPEELEKAYKELEAKLGAPKQESADKGATKPPLPDSEKVAAVEVTDEATTLLRDNGLDISTYTHEFESTGQLSEESYAALEKAGISRQMVGDYINSQRILLDSQVQKIKDSVGGTAEYQKLVDWAAVNMSHQEQQAYARILGTKDVALITLAAQGMKAHYDAAMGRDPKVVLSGSTPAGNDGLERFESRAQMVEAMKDPRYEKDPAYRDKVMQKVLRSNI